MAAKAPSAQLNHRVVVVQKANLFYKVADADTEWKTLESTLLSFGSRSNGVGEGLALPCYPRGALLSKARDGFLYEVLLLMN